MASSLKKFHVRFFGYEDLDKAFLEISTDGPRGAIIVGATILENALRFFLAKRMVPLRADDYDRLFNGDGPLARFANAIRIAHAFGLIGQKTKRDFDNIRALRNVFAHGSPDITFDTPEIAKMITSLNCIVGLKKSLPTRDLYSSAIRFLILHLASKFDQTITVPPAHISILD